MGHRPTQQHRGRLGAMFYERDESVYQSAWLVCDGLNVEADGVSLSVAPASVLRGRCGGITRGKSKASAQFRTPPGIRIASES